MLALWILLSTLPSEMTQEEAVKLATEVLAHDLGLSTDLVELRGASPVDWPDSSLGCAKEGEVYLQVVTPGYLVSLEVDGQVFSVHVGSDRAFVCGSALRGLEGARVKEILHGERERGVSLATETLAEHLGVPEDDLRLQSVSPVTWPDRGLGCPEAGVSREPAPTPGFRVLLRAGEQIFRVHVSSESAVVCGGPLVVEGVLAPDQPPLNSTKIEPALAPVVDVARTDLAGRLAVAEEEIETVEARAVVWPDASMGCPRPETGYIQVPQEGTLVRLRHGARIYAYHSGGSRGPFLCEERGKKPATR